MSPNPSLLQHSRIIVSHQRCIVVLLIIGVHTTSSLCIVCYAIHSVKVEMESAARLMMSVLIEAGKSLVRRTREQPFTYDHYLLSYDLHVRDTLTSHEDQ